MIGAYNLAPLHGLWRAGKVTLPNAAQVDYPMPSGYVAEIFGTSRLFRVPGLLLPPRTIAQQSADAAAGHQWRDYALLAGAESVYAGEKISRTSPGLSGTDKCWLYADATGAVWRIRAEAFWIQGSQTATVTFKVRRFGLFDGQPHSEWNTTQTGIGMTGEVLYAAAEFAFLNASPSGNEAWLATMFDFVGLGAHPWPLVIMRVGVTGNGVEGQPGCGLTFSVSVYDSQSIDIDGNLTANQVTPFGGIQYLWPCYDASGALSWFTFQRRQTGNTLSAGYAMGSTVLHGVSSTWNGQTSNGSRMLPDSFGSVPAVGLPLRNYVAYHFAWYYMFFENAAYWDGARWKMVYPVRYASNVFGLVTCTATINQVLTGISEGLLPSGYFSVYNQPLNGSVRLEGAWSAGGQSASFDVAAPTNSLRPTQFTGSNPENVNAVSGRFATWQPVTGQLVVDTVPVVWV